MKHWRQAVLRRARILVVLCAVGLLLPWLVRATAASAARWAWLLDMAGHWQWLYAGGLLLAAAVAAWQQPRWWLALPLAALPWWSAAPRAPSATTTAPVLSIVTANVHHDNPDPQPLLDWITRTDPDLVVLLEVTAAMAARLETLAQYPHRHIVPGEDPFGIALLSRHSFAAVSVLHDALGIARIEAQVAWPGQCIDLIGWHPMPPLSPAFRHSRDQALRALATGAGARPRIIAGDLNATPWSSAFAGLDALGLRRASGLAPTWPVAGRGVLGIPIDHVLVSAHWSVLESERGPDIGSDHYPQAVRLVLSTPASGSGECAPD